MEDDTIKRWVGGICIHDNKVALIYRINKERLFHQEYFVFPGNYVEGDENIENTLVQEFSTLSLTVKLGDFFYSTNENEDETEEYYLCDYVFGEPSLLQNKSQNEDDKQFYTAMWVSISELEEMIVYPETVKEKIIERSIL